MLVTHIGKVEQGKLIFSSPVTLAKDVSRYEGKEVAITISEKKYQRSSAQNRYFWGVVVPLVSSGLTDAGFENITPDSCHSIIKELFCEKELVNINTGEIIKVHGGTSGLSPQAFSALVENVQRWAAEYLSVQIPNPNE